MRAGSNLTEKALLALEEVIQEARYRLPEQTHALRFALAYLHSLKPGRRELFDDFWRVLFLENDLHRFGYSDRALLAIYHHLAIERDEEVSRIFWRAAQERRERDRDR